MIPAGAERIKISGKSDANHVVTVAKDNIKIGNLSPFYRMIQLKIRQAVPKAVKTFGLGCLQPFRAVRTHG